MFEKEFPIISNKLPSEFLLYKKRLREKKGFEDNELIKIKERALKFIGECEHILI